MSITAPAASAGAETQLSDNQLSRYLDLAEEALVDIAEDPDLSEPETARLLSLVGQLATSLRQAPTKGSGPVETAVTVIVGDVHVHTDTWERNRSKKWYKIVASIVGGLLLALQAVGGYPGIKELTHDLGFGPSVPVTATPVEPKRAGLEAPDRDGPMSGKQLRDDADECDDAG